MFEIELSPRSDSRVNDERCGTLRSTVTSRLANTSNLGEAFTQEILNPCRQIFAIPDRMCFYELSRESRRNQKTGYVPSICGQNLRCRKVNFDEDIESLKVREARGVRQAKFTAFDTVSRVEILT